MSVKGAKFTVQGSTADQLLEFFQNNPDEELTMEDIQAKFGAKSANTAHNAVRRHADLLEYAKVVRLKSKGVAQ